MAHRRGPEPDHHRRGSDNHNSRDGDSNRGTSLPKARNEYPEARTLFTNPLLQKVRRRPAQLNLSRSIATPTPRPEPAKKHVRDMTVGEKLQHGVSLYFRHLQQKSPAAFEKLYPAKPAQAPPGHGAATTRSGKTSHGKHATSSVHQTTVSKQSVSKDALTAEKGEDMFLLERFAVGTVAA